MRKKYYFILNPAAGQGKALDLRDSIEEIAKKANLDFEIYETKEELDGQVITGDFAKLKDDDCSIRIYACGGDGTLNEIINGVIGFDNVEIGIIPTGTGNDFIRNFAREELFNDIEAQINGDSIEVDTIRYRYYKNDYSQERYCINMFNIGFDSTVVEKAGNLKKLPGISGNFAYTLGVAGTLLEKKAIDIAVVRKSRGKGDFNEIVDDSNHAKNYEKHVLFDGKALLTAIGNGCFCGGGIKALPKASCTDGLMDVGIVKNCKRREVAQLFGKYKKGEHLNTKLGKKLVTYVQTDNLIIKSNGMGDLLVSVDGELERADWLEAVMEPKSIKFIVPKRIEN